jgi:predicted transcriptional regulator YdeE
LEFNLTTVNGLSVCGLKTELSTSQKENYNIIRKHWKKFNNALRNRKLTQGANWKKYGISQKLNDRYFYLSAIPMDIKISGFENIEIEKGTFAHFQHIGSMELISETIYNIYKRIIPESFLNIDKERTLLHYEYYDYRFHWNKSDSIIDIYVPVESL